MVKRSKKTGRDNSMETVREKGVGGGGRGHTGGKWCQKET